MDGLVLHHCTELLWIYCPHLPDSAEHRNEFAPSQVIKKLKQFMKLRIIRVKWKRRLVSLYSQVWGENCLKQSRLGTREKEKKNKWMRR